ncbi:MAG: hypothetical protein HYT08_03925 [Candidatus Levybacteria bacterium]|nr:hypothetical protein [Candidatus Levybacteria bacterium]
MSLNFLKLKRRTVNKQVMDYKQELLVKQGREQFKALLKRGLSVPIALL